MAFHLHTSILLPHPPAKVWEVLADFPAYPTWNPFVTKISGEPRVGEKIAVCAGGMDFQPRLLEYRPKEEIRWRGNFLLPGIFDGEHYFRLTAREDGQTLLEHGEHFRGLLLPVFKYQMLEKTRGGFESMNEALKERLAETA